MDNLFTSCCAGIYVSPEETKTEESVVEKTAFERVAECQSKYKISDARVAEYRESFNMLDKDGNGMLDNTELGNAMHFWGENPTTFEIQSLIKKFDENNSGAIEFPEYLTMMAYRQKESVAEQACAAAFSQFDSNRNGFITVQDTIKGIEEQSMVCTDKQIKQIGLIVDKNSAGELNYSQVVKLLRKKGILALK